VLEDLARQQEGVRRNRLGRREDRIVDVALESPPARELGQDRGRPAAEVEAARAGAEQARGRLE